MIHDTLFTQTTTLHTFQVKYNTNPYPSSYTADPLGGCFQTVPSYKPTVVCDVYDHSYRAVSKSTSTYTTDGTTIEEVVPSTTTIHSYTTHSETWIGDEFAGFADFYTPLLLVDAITLIHHESDVAATGNGGTTTAIGTSTGGSVVAMGTGKSTGTAASTSNAGVRLAPRGSSWGGFGAVLSVSLAATALGAAIILPI